MKIYVLGAGGHAKVVVATLQASGREVAGLFDDASERHGTSVLGVPVLGALPPEPATGAGYVIGIGLNTVRRRIAVHWADQATWIPAVHPRAYVHPDARIGPGTVICAGAVVQPGAVIGSHCIVNTGATVDHDTTLEDFVHVAPGSHLAGQVHVCEGAMIGIGSAVIPSVRIGAWSTVGAGAAVVSDVPPGVTAAGVPARILTPRTRPYVHRVR